MAIARMRQINASVAHGTTVCRAVSAERFCSRRGRPTVKPGLKIGSKSLPKSSQWPSAGSR